MIEQDTSDTTNLGDRLAEAVSVILPAIMKREIEKMCEIKQDGYLREATKENVHI